MTPSCGRIFCDIDLPPIDGWHELPDGDRLECPINGRGILNAPKCPPLEGVALTMPHGA